MTHIAMSRGVNDNAPPPLRALRFRLYLALDLGCAALGALRAGLLRAGV
jgi:hypothetical protein